MKILGIDYGRKKMGLAIAVRSLAEPLCVIRYSDNFKLIENLKKIISEEKIEKIIVGISEGDMAEESKLFSLDLSKSLNIAVETFDETLSTYDAQKLSIESGMSRKKRHEMEDAFAATVVLQSYIDYV